ncbi:copper-translocating P-type ATPase [Fodinibius salsisoli]|uniref:Copper-translocating P-type ATPase n=1 Tax=Fodinibius salsisoli TaxID=2820877 RepID=A0ABT3PNU9_9BACT|nr:copper-translocating P-type ATPase [Fodinibius salsisoli]MCW9707527.1 copper-translocating P-type ATPase [Fodinibius salsisoli]
MKNTDHHNHQHQEPTNNDNEHHDHHTHMLQEFKKRFFVSALPTILILLLSPMIQEFLGIGDQLHFQGDMAVLFLLSTFVYVYGGWPFLKGVYDEIKDKQPGMMTLIGLAITVAYVYSTAVVFGLSGKLFYWELATLVLIMLAGHWIEMRSVMSASRALEELAKLMPDTAHRLKDDGSTEEVGLDELRSGDKLVIKPGEKVPADGEVVDGKTQVNESLLTGESKPVSKKEGDEVIGGAINEEGSITVKVTKTGDESFLSQVISLVEQAQQSKSRTQNLANRAAAWLTFVALGAGALTLFGWSFWSSQDFVFAIERTVTVMVITCPHALGLAIPLVIAVSTSRAASHGFLIRNRTAFEQARTLDAIIFDKTGTLTKGEFGVTDIRMFSETFSKKELLTLAASLETRSEHSIAQGIVEASEETFAVESFNAITGKGVEGQVDGKKIAVVSPGYLEEQNINIPDRSSMDELASTGKTIVYILVEGSLEAAIALGDQIREESYEAIRRLKESGIQCMMLTGDNEQVAGYVADELGLEDYFAEVLPDEKSDKVKEVQQRGLSVAMVGDGVNDAPALAQADVGIAIGAGSDVAVETADLVLVKNNPKDVVWIVLLAKATYRKMIQNLWWASGYNIIAIPLAAGVFAWAGIVLSPAVGAVLMSLSTVIVAVNARFLDVEKERSQTF